jgi:hypothetical protein
VSFIPHEYYGRFLIINIKLLTMHVGFKRVDFDEGLGLIHEFDGRLLSNDLQKFIVQDLGVCFGKTYLVGKVFRRGRQ